MSRSEIIKSSLGQLFDMDDDGHVYHYVTTYIEQLEQERDQLKEKLEIATGALSHYLYGGSNYSQIARDALEEIKGDQHETNT